MRRFEAFKLEISNKQHKHQFDILPHPPELLENIPVKFQVFLNGRNQGYLYKTFRGWRVTRAKDPEIIDALVEKIHGYYKAKEEHEKELKKKDNFSKLNRSLLS